MRALDSIGRKGYSGMEKCRGGVGSSSKAPPSIKLNLQWEGFSNSKGYIHIYIYIYTSSIYPVLPGQYRLKSYHFWLFLVTMVTIL